MKDLIKRIFNRLGFEIHRIPPPPEIYCEIDPEFTTRYNSAQQATDMTGSDNLLRRQRHYTLLQLVKQAPLSADVAECGCWKGLSAWQTSRVLSDKKFKNTYFLFDSFEGLSEFRKEDLNGVTIPDPENRRKDFACSLETVKKNLVEFPFIDYRKGWIPERFPEVKDRRFGFVHIDVDLYQPIRDSLEFFYPRMVSGGIIVLDDYGFLCFPGAKKATDEFLATHSCFFMSLPSGSAFIIKTDS